MPARSQRTTAVVTGASQGIGAEIAESLARRGYDLLLAARGAARLEALAARLEATYGVRARVAVVDLQTRDGVEALIESAARAPAPVGIVVNNAGFGDTETFHSATWARHESMLALNVQALTRLTHHFGAQFAERGGGYIMNVASTAAFQPNPGFAVYGAGKAYVLSLSRAIREELRGKRVTVTALCPGPTDTPFHDRAGTRGALISKLSMLSARTVAERGVQGMLAGRAVVVPGLLNQALIASLRFVPSFMVPRVAALLMRSPTG